MTTPTNPPISLENVRAELQTSYPISLNQANVLQLANKSGPPISLLDLLGKTNAPMIATVVSNEYNDGVDDWWGYDDGTITSHSFGSIVNSGSVVINSITSSSTSVTYLACNQSNFTGKSITITHVASGSSQTGTLQVGGTPQGGIYIYSAVPYFSLLTAYPIGATFRITAGN